MKALEVIRIARAAVRSKLATGPLPTAPNHDVGNWLDVIRRDGVCVLPEYYSSETCAELASAFEQLVERCPAAVRSSSDEAEQRIYGIDNAIGDFGAFSNNPTFLELAGGILGTGATNVFTLGNKITSQDGNLGSGGGWHRDSFFNQFKALVYLTDVTETSGPFEYILGSHRLARKFGDAIRLNVPLDTARVPDAIAEACIRMQPENHRVFTASRGTVVVFDATGIHRGRPLTDGMRMALTNYYYPRRDVSQKLIDHFSPVLGHHVPLPPDSGAESETGSMKATNG